MTNLSSLVLNHMLANVQAASQRMHESNDCAVIALALITPMTYAMAHDTLAACGRKSRTGVPFDMLLDALRLAGITEWDYIPFRPREYRDEIHAYNTLRERGLVDATVRGFILSEAHVSPIYGGLLLANGRDDNGMPLAAFRITEQYELGEVLDND